MINITPYIEKLNLLKEYMDAWIELKAWMANPLKPFPWKAHDKIDIFNKQECIDNWNKKYSKIL